MKVLKLETTPKTRLSFDCEVKRLEALLSDLNQADDATDYDKQLIAELMNQLSTAIEFRYVKV